MSFDSSSTASISRSSESGDPQQPSGYASHDVRVMARLELGFSVRSGEVGREAFGLPPLSLMPIEHLTPAMEDRAFEVQMLLADRGQHRAPSIPDLLIAATAEKAGLTVLAVDKDFDLTAEITGQSVETLALV